MSSRGLLFLCTITFGVVQGQVCFVIPDPSEREENCENCCIDSAYYPGGVGEESEEIDPSWPTKFDGPLYDELSR